MRIGSPRVALLTRLNTASDVEDISIQAIQEVQVRFLMAAAGAGVIELRMEEPDLREALRSQEGDMRTSIKQNALANAANCRWPPESDSGLRSASSLNCICPNNSRARSRATSLEIPAMDSGNSTFSRTVR